MSAKTFDPTGTHEVRAYETVKEGKGMAIRRLVNQDTNESWYFGQANMMGTTPDGQPIQTVAWFPIDGATSPKNAFDNLEQAFLKFKADSQRRIIVPAGVPPAPMPKGNGPMPDGMRVV